MSQLKGTLVLDLSRILAGPLCGMMLGDLGATVIKVESLHGDDTRTWGPPFFTGSSTGSSSQEKLPQQLGDSLQGVGESAYYLSINRNKKSLAVDLGKSSGRQLIQSLAQRADVILENFRVGSLRKFALDYDTVAKKNPRVVYCSITGYGQFGEKAAISGYDFIIQGESGFMSITGDVHGEPMKVGVAISDVLAGNNACIAILAALLGRKDTGKGEYIDISLLDCSLASLVNVASNVLVSKAPTKRFGNHHPNIVPYGSFTAQNRTFNLAIGNDRQFADFARMVGQTAWIAPDGQYATNRQRVEKREDLIQKINALLSQESAEYWIEACRKAHIPAGLVHSFDEALNQKHSVTRKVTRTASDHPLGTLEMMASPIRFQNDPINRYQTPPLLGEHTREILQECLQLPEAHIQELVAEQAVYQNPLCRRP